MQRSIKSREELIADIKKCGQSIIDNAESILGDERYFIDLTVRFDIRRSIEESTSINISRNFIPEDDIEEERNKYERKYTRTEK